MRPHVNTRSFSFAAVLGLAALCLAAGCRREDYREFTVEVPGMTGANIAAIKNAVTFYDGVDPDSIRWDLEAKTLTLRFDSLKVAQTNIRMAIANRGIEVTFPQKPEGSAAGYINERGSEVESTRRYPGAAKR